MVHLAALVAAAILVGLALAAVHEREPVRAVACMAATVGLGAVHQMTVLGHGWDGALAVAAVVAAGYSVATVVVVKRTRARS